MAATVKVYIATGAGPTTTTVDSADGGSFAFNRADTVAGTATIPIPTATGNKYSYLKYLFLDVTATAATSISNRRIAWATSPTTGLQGLWLNQATYTQNTGTQGTGAGQYPLDDTAANGTIPGTPAWAGLTTTNQLWDNTSVSTGSTGRNGNYVELCLQVSNAFAGGGGATTAVPTLDCVYDES